MPAFWLYYYSISNLGTNNTPEIRNGVRNIHLHQWLWETCSLSTLSFYLIHRKKGGGKGAGAEVRSWVESWGRAPGLIKSRAAGIASVLCTTGLTGFLLGRNGWNVDPPTLPWTVKLQGALYHFEDLSLLKAFRTHGERVQDSPTSHSEDCTFITSVIT